MIPLHHRADTEFSTTGGQKREELDQNIDEVEKR